MKCQFCSNEIKGLKAFKEKKAYHPNCLIRYKNNLNWEKRFTWLKNGNKRK